MAEQTKILQIIKADGWLAWYADEDGEEEYASLVCFALTETLRDGKLEQAVRPMRWLAEGRMGFADEEKNFGGVMPADAADEDEEDEDEE